jgi:hypothetical protein
VTVRVEWERFSRWGVNCGSGGNSCNREFGSGSIECCGGILVLMMGVFVVVEGVAMVLVVVMEYHK